MSRQQIADVSHYCGGSDAWGEVFLEEKDDCLIISGTYDDNNLADGQEEGDKYCEDDEFDVAYIKDPVVRDLVYRFILEVSSSLEEAIEDIIYEIGRGDVERHFKT